MKKFGIILSAVFYLLCAAGLYVHAHYCGGELFSVTYSALTENHDCGCGDESSDDSCCKDVWQFHKVDAHQSYQAVFAKIFFQQPLHDFIQKITLAHFHHAAINTLGTQAHAPPFLFYKTNQFIVYRVFRI
jgi:hypothetical protein